MNRDKILATLQTVSGGLPTIELANLIDSRRDSAVSAALDALLLFSPEVTRGGDRWKLIGRSKTVKILAAIESYSDSTGKKIFRLSAALGNLPVHEHPTEVELKKALDASNGRFQLLPNAMIKRNG